jgi:rfaE bifunctional protein kinase chain/domain
MDAPEIREIFDAFEGMTVLVVGDSMLDAYMWGTITRNSPEAPVPIVDISRRENRLGGAANVALNVKSLNGRPILCSVIGPDKYGEEFLKEMERNGLPTDGMISLTDRKTTVKTRVIADEKHVVRVDEEQNDDIPHVQRIVNHVIDQIIAYRPQVIIFEDYNKGMLSEKVITEIIEYAKTHRIPTVVDPKVKNFLAYRGVTLFKPNLREISQGLGRSVCPTHKEGLKIDLEELRTKLNGSSILLTMSEHGMVFWDGSELYHTPAQERVIRDVSGAGDTSVAVAAMVLAAGAGSRWITHLANTAGGLVCESPGVVPIDKDLLHREGAKRIIPSE